MVHGEALSGARKRRADFRAEANGFKGIKWDRLRPLSVVAGRWNLQFAAAIRRAVAHDNAAPQHRTGRQAVSNTLGSPLIFNNTGIWYQLLSSLGPNRPSPLFFGSSAINRLFWLLPAARLGALSKGAMLVGGLCKVCRADEHPLMLCALVARCSLSVVVCSRLCLGRQAERRVPCDICARGRCKPRRRNLGKECFRIDRF